MGIIFWEIANRVVTGKYAQPYSEFKQIDNPTSRSSSRSAALLLLPLDDACVVMGGREV